MDKEKAFESEDTLDATWVVDSECGEYLLLDNRTGQVLARRDQNGDIVEPEGNK
jgi:hypothetical protein